ncbi:hypothetical protein [Nereida sp. MMG025]|uniref:hypothetical protein n=1 Tax=Nereida sp. MMG025 TaxID=2909981 RepID=UPI001F3E4644|nr:hypothetical protein [Nereida sp. MMG025]MCF6444134.1 hypothetical protein [Nereida sp. MMG025]
MTRLPLLICLASLAACGPTFEDAPKLSDVEVQTSSESGTPAAVVAPPSDADIEAALPSLVDDIAQQIQTNKGDAEPKPRRSLVGWLRDRSLPDPATAPQAPVAEQDTLAVVADTGDTEEQTPQAELAQTEPPLAPEDTPEQAVTDAQSDPAGVTQAAPVAQASLFGIFRRPQAASPADVTPAADAQVTQTAAAAPTQTTRPANPSRRGGLLRRNEPTGPDANEIAFGETVPYGAIARVCDAPKRRLGTEVDKFPARGTGYRLFDSNPSGTSLRAHYITGFKDGCVRQFTAATATFGTTEGHERIRYMPVNKSIPFSQTDQAYEALKTQECRVGRNQPCEGRREDKFRQATVFITAYGSFGGNQRWNDILIHDGQVIEKSYKGR